MEGGPKLQAQRRRRTLEESLRGRDGLLRMSPPGLPAAPRELGLCKRRGRRRSGFRTWRLDRLPGLRPLHGQEALHEAVYKLHRLL